MTISTINTISKSKLQKYSKNGSLKYTHISAWSASARGFDGRHSKLFRRRAQLCRSGDREVFLKSAPAHAYTVLAHWPGALHHERHFQESRQRKLDHNWRILRFDLTQS